MAAYTIEFQKSPGDIAGNHTTTITEQQFNDGGFISSNDLIYDGPTVKTKDGRIKVVQDASQLADDDRVVVEGIPMTIKQAREAGIPFDLPASPKARAADGERGVIPQAEPNVSNELDLGPDPYNRDEEVVLGETMADSVRLHTGLSANDTFEMGADIIRGLDRDDPLWTALAERGISKDAAIRSADQARQAVATGALKELGEKDYRELEGYASKHWHVRELLIMHGMKRLNGTAKVGWKDVLGLARDHSRK